MPCRDYPCTSAPIFPQADEASRREERGSGGPTGGIPQHQAWAAPRRLHKPRRNGALPGSGSHGWAVPGTPRERNQKRRRFSVAARRREQPRSRGPPSQTPHGRAPTCSSGRRRYRAAAAPASRSHSPSGAGGGSCAAEPMAAPRRAGPSAARAPARRGGTGPSRGPGERRHGGRNGGRAAPRERGAAPGSGPAAGMGGPGRGTSSCRLPPRAGRVLAARWSEK